jgi:hypothetical protein
VCHKINNNNLKGVDLACPLSQLCQDHRCSMNSSGVKCRKERIACSLYCQDHSCKECKGGDIINAAIEKAPRNHCAKHALCEFIDRKGKTCNAIRVQASLYCVEHEKNEAQNVPHTIDTNKKAACSGITSKRKNCLSNLLKHEIKGKWYCDAHVSQAPKEGDSSDENNNKVDDKEDENNIKKAFTRLVPVIPTEESIAKFKKVKCTEKLCDVEIFLEVDKALSNWFCPIHKKLEKAVVDTDKKDIAVDQIESKAAVTQQSTSNKTQETTKLLEKENKNTDAVLIDNNFGDTKNIDKDDKVEKSE